MRKTHCANAALEQREIVSVKYEDEELTYPRQIEEHMDICLKTNSIVLPMNYPVPVMEEVESCLKKKSARRCSRI